MSSKVMLFNAGQKSFQNVRNSMTRVFEIKLVRIVVICKKQEIEGL